MLRQIHILIFLALITGNIFAQKTKFTARAPATVQVGKQFQYTVEGNDQGTVKIPSTADFEYLNGPFTSFSSSTQWINGKMTMQTTASYTFVMRGLKEGEYVIPPAVVKVKKESYKTNEVKISVVNAENSVSQSSGTGQTVSTNPEMSQGSNELPPIFLKVIPSKKSVYIGEQLVSELKVYTSVNTRPGAGFKEVPYEGFYKHSLDADQYSARENIQGKTYVTQTLMRDILIPQKSGKVVIEPFESEWMIQERVKRNRSGSIYDDFFNDPFFDQVREVPKKISTAPVTINVKPLPDNAPEGFTGAVGKMKMTAELSESNIAVNDALSLKIKVLGTGNIPLIGTPKVDFPPDHDLYEVTKSTNVNTSGNLLSGSVVFEYPLVVRHAGNYRIAPIKFSWFDPVEEKYKTIVSDEFVFTVVKGEDTGEDSQIYIPGMRGEEVKNIGTDILDISRAVSEYSKIGKSLLSSWIYWISFPILLLLFIIIFLVLRIYFKQKADIRLVRNRKANKVARIRLRVADKARHASDSEQFFEEIEKAIWGYLSDKLNIELSTLSREKVDEVLANSGIEDNLRNDLFNLLDECEFSRYAPSSEKSDMDKLYINAASLINKLEQKIRVK